MRVLLVTNDYPPRPGGIQSYLRDLVRHFPGELRVAAPSGPAQQGVARADRGYLWPTPAVREWLVHQIGDFGPEVVVFGAPLPLAPLGPPLRRRTAVPYAVMTYGGDLTVPAAVPGLRSLLRRTLRQADALFALSRFTERRVRVLTGRPVQYLGTGVDTTVFHPPPTERAPGPTVIGSVGRFVPRKGQERVLAAAADLAGRGHSLEVLLVGTGRQEGRLRRLAASQPYPVTVEADVADEDLPGLYRRMDVFCQPVRSRWLGLEVEGLGIVFLEAAASGLPVIGGWSGGAPETVVPGVTGFLAHRHADVVEALELLLGHPERAAEMGRRGREMVLARYSWEATVARFQAGLRSALGGEAE